MHTVAALTDIHARTHVSLAGLLDHCAGFSAEEVRRELDGFGYGTILLQLHHVIGAEKYWVGVLRGLMLGDAIEAEYDALAARGADSVDALREYREAAATTTRDYLAGCSDADVSTPREMSIWTPSGDSQVALVPADVILRTQTHVFQHQGQVAAMSRLLGRPVSDGLAYPLR
jgi:uncharacterized damage-inducible protein DinB